VSLASCAVDLGTGLISGDGRSFALCAVDPNAGTFKADDALLAAFTGVSLAGNWRTDFSAALPVSGTKAACNIGFCANPELRSAGVSTTDCGSISTAGGGERSGAAKSAFTKLTPNKTPTVAAPTSPSESR
jgi:hypothetical protein